MHIEFEKKKGYTVGCGGLVQKIMQAVGTKIRFSIAVECWSTYMNPTGGYGRLAPKNAPSNFKPSRSQEVLESPVQNHESFAEHIRLET